MVKGKFIVIEGLDATGKTTIVPMLSASIDAMALNDKDNMGEALGVLKGEMIGSFCFTFVNDYPFIILGS